LFSSWSSLIDSAQQQLLDNSKSQDRKPNPDDPEFPVDIEGQDAKTNATENPKNQQAIPVCRVPLGTRVHAVRITISRMPRKSGEIRTPPVALTG